MSTKKPAKNPPMSEPPPLENPEGDAKFTPARKRRSAHVAAEKPAAPVVPEKRKLGEHLPDAAKARLGELILSGRSNEQATRALIAEKLLHPEDEIGRNTYNAVRREIKRHDLAFTVEGVQVGEWGMSQVLLQATHMIEGVYEQFFTPAGKFKIALSASKMSAMYRVWEGSAKLLFNALGDAKSEPLLAFMRLMAAETKRVEEDPALTIAERARTLRELQIWQTERLLNLHNLMKAGGKMPTLEELAAAGFTRTPENDVSRAAAQLGEAEKAAAAAGEAKP